MKVAIGLFVKNEAPEIFSWLAWYQYLGVDTIFVGVDNSSDNTLDLLKDASKVFDIRVESLPFDAAVHTVRQKKFFEKILEVSKNEFDWIGFFDADEYLSLIDNENIKDFLYNFDDTVGQVSINWCNYGSSQNIIKPQRHPTYSYIHHSSKNHHINKHVKSFVNPKYWDKAWFNFHVFSVGDKKTVDSNGNEIVFGETKGITKYDPDWSKAKIMHYQSRSMEHFIERAKNKKNVIFSTDLWLAYDFKDEIDKTPQKKEKELKNITEKYVEVTIRRVSENIKTSPYINNEKKDFLDPIDNVGPVNIFYIRNHEGDFIKSDENRTYPSLEIGNDMLIAIMFENRNQCFICSSSGGRFDIINEKRLVGLLKYEIIPEGNYFVFLHPNTNLFLSCAPISCGGTLSVDRQIAKNWEKFSLEKVENEIILNKILENIGISWVKNIRNIPVSSKDIADNYMFDSEKTISSICFSLNILPTYDSNLVSFYFGGSKDFIL